MQVQEIPVELADGRYSLVAGQRRLLAFQHLGRDTIPAVIRDAMTDENTTVVSLVENVHRADMNPRDKAAAFKTLVDRLGNLQAVSRETGVGEGAIRKYIQLGVLGYHIVRNCPFDCPTIPEPLKRQVAAMVDGFESPN